MVIHNVCGSNDIDANAMCPICRQPGKKIKQITVQSLVRDEKSALATEEYYFLCLSEDCEVVYFNEAGNVCFTKEDVKVPVWFKEKNSPKPICYCKNVSDTTILEHVIKLGHRTIEEIQKYTGANTGKECIVKSPAGG